MINTIFIKLIRFKHPLLKPNVSQDLNKLSKKFIKKIPTQNITYYDNRTWNTA